jgi:hypothetical protein
MGETVGGGGDVWTGAVCVDARLIERAMLHDWPVPEDTRKKAIERMAQIIESPEASNRDCTAAVRVLLSASRVSLNSVITTIAADDHVRLCDRVSKIAKKEKLMDERRAQARQSSP